MLIRHDPHLSRGRVLMPVPRRQWYFSQAWPKDQFGNDSFRVQYRVRARLHDGHIAWTGWFEDRDDADAFLFAASRGTLGQERELWRLCSPEWHPGIAGQVYECATFNFLTSPTGSLQTYTRPADWTATSNIAHVIGAGGSGGAARGTPRIATGGGGGGYSSEINLAIGATASYQIGVGGAARTQSTNGTNAGAVGGDSWFNGATLAASSAGAKGGSGGGAAVTTVAVNGGAGGDSASGFGSVKITGGRGGNMTAVFAATGTGGGGAAGPRGAGNNGVDTTTDAATNGGSGGAGFGGSAGAGDAVGNAAGAGGNGAEITTSYGSGGGGGGMRDGTANNQAGQGGTYGGGGGGSVHVNFAANSGAGRQGVIVVVYALSLVFNPLPLQHIFVR